MVREVPITRQRIQANPVIQETGGPTGGARLSQNVSNILVQQRDQYQQQAIENNFLKGQSIISEEVARLESEYATDPANLTEALGEYSTSFLEEVSDPNAAARYQLQFDKASQTAIARSTAKRQAIIDDETKFQIFKDIDGLETEMANTAVDMFNPNPAVALAASEQMQEQMMRGQQLLDQTSADGTPLLSANQRSSSLLALRDQTYLNGAKAWMESQENELAAAADWLDNKVEIELPDGEGGLTRVNVRDSMPAASRNKADNLIMSTMRDRLAIQSQQMQIQEQQDEAIADEMFVSDQERLQNAALDPEIQPLTLQELDARREAYIAGNKEDEFVALRNTIISGEPTVVNGAVRNQLMDMAFRGMNPDQLGVLAVKSGQIRWEDLNEARQVFKGITGPSADTASFYTQQLTRALGGFNAQLDPASNETVSRAVIELQQQFRQARQEAAEAGRAFTDTDAERVFNRVLTANSNLNLEDRVTARTPQFIPKSEVGQQMNEERAADFTTRVNEHFLRKYNGDADKVKADPDYIESREWLHDYRSQLKPNDFQKVQ